MRRQRSRDLSPLLRQHCSFVPHVCQFGRPRDAFADGHRAPRDRVLGLQVMEGRFRAVGTETFGRPFAEPAAFDQQPLEAQATIDACAAAFAVTRDPRWTAEAERAYRWFLGANDLDLPLASPQDGGCFDGLMPHGVNRNQGAESILALQLASCAISALSKQGGTVAGAERAVA